MEISFRKTASSVMVLTACVCVTSVCHRSPPRAHFFPQLRRVLRLCSITAQMPYDHKIKYLFNENVSSCSTIKLRSLRQRASIGHLQLWTHDMFMTLLVYSRVTVVCLAAGHPRGEGVCFKKYNVIWTRMPAIIFAKIVFPNPVTAPIRNLLSIVKII